MIVYNKYSCILLDVKICDVGLYVFCHVASMPLIFCKICLSFNINEINANIFRLEMVLLLEDIL